MSLADLIANEHDLLLERFCERARQMSESAGIDRVELIDSMSFFIDDLIEALAGELRISPQHSAAASHGVERLSIGFRIDRVVREYVLVAHLILELAEEHGYALTAREQHVLFEAIGDGAALAAAEFARRREADVLQQESEHVALLGHEVRNSLASARFAFELLQRREFADAAALAHIVEAGLSQASNRIDDVLTGARMRGGIVSPVRVFPLLMLEEIAAELTPQATARQIAMIVEGPRDLTAQLDVRLLRSAVENLANNAVKFSCTGGTVGLRAFKHAEHLVIEVADSCGGLFEGQIERLFRPFVQGGKPGVGFGLGLAIARDCAEAQGGSLHVRNIPSHGCVFSLTLPLRP